MLKRILLPLLTALFIALSFVLPPFLFRLFDQTLLATQQQEDYTIISANGADLSLTQKLVLLSTGDSMILPFSVTITELKSGLFQQLDELEKLGFLPIHLLQSGYSLTDQLFVDQRLFVKDGQTLRVASITLSTPEIQIMILYCPQDEKILAFYVDYFDQLIYENVASVLEGATQSPEALFLDYLGVSLENTKTFIDYTNIVQNDNQFAISLFPRSYETTADSGESAVSPTPRYE